MKKFDLGFKSNTVAVIAGVDEAGRGPLAGPVVAAAAVFDDNCIIDGINDSKKLNEKTRELLYPVIIEKATAWGCTVIDNNIIDEINILQASLRAMKESVAKLDVIPDLVLIDGNKSYVSDIPVQTIIKGDGKSFSIAAASIIAKVTRDRIMVEFSKKYPVYKWAKNKGYATKEHIAAIKEYGPCELHRKTFLGRILSENKEYSLF